MKKTYMCIDLKSFYASVECVERGLDPLDTNLVVADSSRTDKTICLAVSPSLKSYGLSGRCRLFEAKQKVREVNYYRKKNNNYKSFTGKSVINSEIMKDNGLELDFIIATPRMKKYMKYSTDIYNIYLKYLAPEDIFVYSIDEVFCDISAYLNTYKMSPKELVSKIIRDVYDTTGITATAGIGTNLYLAKISMDIVAKHTEADEIGVRIAEIDELSYRKLLWEHRPITDFWRVGNGYAKKLAEHNMFTMGDVARCSIDNENLLYKLFGVNAELLIDHAWGYEPTTIEDVKNYKPNSNSISEGQVLHCPYNYEKTKLIVREMIDNLALSLVSKKKVTDKIVLTIGYDIDNLTNPDIRSKYFGEITIDQYGRKIPKQAHGTINLDYRTSSSKVLMKKGIELFDKIINKNLLTKRVNVTVCNIVSEDQAGNDMVYEQMDLFSVNNTKKSDDEIDKQARKDELALQKIMIDLKNKYGKNAILRAMNLEEGATARDRNNQVGGHRG